MTLADGEESVDMEEKALEKADRELDCVEMSTDQVSRGTDQERGMDLEQEERRGAISVSDNARNSDPSAACKTKEEEDFGVSVGGELTVSSPFQRTLFFFFLLLLLLRES